MTHTADNTDTQETTVRHQDCMCAQIQREADEIQDLLVEARRSYTDEDWAYINRDIERARAERDAERSSVGGTTTSSEEQTR